MLERLKVYTVGSKVFLENSRNLKHAEFTFVQISLVLDVDKYNYNEMAELIA